MKIKFIFLCLTIIFFTSFLCGCEEIENIPGPPYQNYIVVTVNADICVYNDDENHTPVENHIVWIEIVKAGGERVIESPLTNEDGCTVVTAAFNLYKDQPIVASCYPQHFNNLRQEYTLPWEVVSAKSTDKTYRWDIFFGFLL